MPPRRSVRVFAIAVAAVAALVLGGRWAWDPSRLYPDRGGTHIEAVAGRPRYINPLLSHFNEIDRDLVSLIFAGLVKIGKNGQVEPDLAESWDISADGRIYTFRLRQDRQWHNGQPVVVDDVLFTVRLLQDPAFPGLPDVAEPWRKVEAAKVDERTVRFTLAEPYAPFLEQATIGILPAHLFGALPAADLASHPFNGFPIGAGPFKVSQVSVQQITLVPDPAYPGPQPYLESVAFRFYPSAQAAVTALLQGEATGVRHVPPDEVARLAQDERVQVLAVPNVGRAAVLLLNSRRPPFDDANVRRAISLALDRQGLVATALQGKGEPAYGPICPLCWGYYEQRTERDLERARSLLAAAGWADGDGVREKEGKPLIVPLATSDAPERKRVVAALAAQLAEAGVQVEPSLQTWEQLRDNRLVPRDFAAALTELWLPNYDPDVLLLWHSTQADDGFNFSGWRNGRADELLEKGRRTWTGSARAEVYAEFQKLFAEEAPSVFLYYPTYTFALSADIKGVRAGPILDPADRFRFLGEWYTRTRRAFF